jgi:hypothetical protein
MKPIVLGIAVAATLPLAASSMASAQCAPDAILAGTVCMDKYEASVWRVPDPAGTNAGLVRKIHDERTVGGHQPPATGQGRARA